MEEYYVMGRSVGCDRIAPRNYWWGPFTEIGAKRNYEKRKGMYDTLILVKAIEQETQDDH